MTQSNTTLWWMLIIILLASLGMALYKMLVKSEPVYIQFTIIAALSGAILREIPLFIKYKILNAIPAAAAVILFVLGVLTEIKNK